MLESSLIKVAGFAGSTTLLKKTPTQVFSCEIFDICEEHLFCGTSENGCFWFLQAINFSMLRHKRRKFNRIIFQNGETNFPLPHNPPPEKKRKRKKERKKKGRKEKRLVDSIR